MANRYKIINNGAENLNLSKFDLIKSLVVLLKIEYHSESEDICKTKFIQDSEFIIDNKSDCNDKVDYLEIQIEADVVYTLNIYKYNYLEDLRVLVNDTIGTLNIEIDEDATKKQNDIEDATPLNQIFYGPPGTGKTYNLLNESLNILGETKEKYNLEMKFDLFYKNNTKLLIDRDYKPGNKPYRNIETPILSLFESFHKLSSRTTLTKEQVIAERGWPGSSTYIQNARAFTNFNLVTESWKSDAETLTLTTKGQSFLDNINSNISSGGSFPEILSEDIIDYIYTEIKETKLETMTLWKNIIICSLRWLVSEDYIVSLGSNANINDYRGRLIKYFNYELAAKSFTNYCTAYLRNLQLVEEGIPFIDGKKYYLSETGKKLVDQLSLFDDLVINDEESNRFLFQKLQINGRIEFVTFHQSFSYEEFIEGIRPEVVQIEERKELSYNVKDGIFKQISKKALHTPDENFVLIIDEINRGNISNIFGELITLLESSKRVGNKEELTLKTTYSNKSFGVPKNLYIIGTMNTADRSIGLMDIALRRRFSFIEYPPLENKIEEKIEEDFELRKLFMILNQRISFLLDNDHLLGHAYFMNIKTIKELNIVLFNKILPLLQEYFYDEWSKIQLVFGDNSEWGKKDEHKIIQENKNIDTNEIFGLNELEEYEEKLSYLINPKLLKSAMDKDMLKSIYTKNS